MESTTWSRTRGLLLLCVLAVHGLYAMPMPHRVRESTLQTPDGKAEITRWLDVIHGVGFELERSRFEELVVEYTTQISDGYRRLKDPFRPMMRLTGTGQGWALFASPATHPVALEIAIFDGRAWTTVYRSLDPELTFLRGPMTFRRVRGIWDGSVHRSQKAFQPMVEWIAERAFETYPEATKVRVRLRQQHTVAPGSSEPVAKPRYLRRRFVSRKPS